MVGFLQIGRFDVEVVNHDRCRRTSSNGCAATIPHWLVARCVLLVSLPAIGRGDTLFLAWFTVAFCHFQRDETCG